MGKTEILDALPRLSAQDRAEVQAKLDELAAEAWLEDGTLAEADKRALDAAIADYEADPAAGTPWEQVKLRAQEKLRP